MKKILAVLTLMLSLSMVLVGCSGAKYTKEEDKYIDLANSVIETKYEVKINKDDFKYSVGKESSKNKFDKIAEGEAPEVISVSALSKELPKEGEILEYSLVYNTKTNTIISSDLTLSEGSTEAK